MSKLYLEWVEKAEGDYHTALREYRVRKYPNYDAACFHAQQCLEKYLKACLQREEIYFPKTHDLNALLDLLLSTHPLLEVIRNDLKLISSYGVEVRYPGESATKEEARVAISIMKKIRSEFRQLLHLEDK